ncbi:MAG: hypothetical protein JF591_16990, partial [Lysobacter sp.]|nr:hypothetical protein [Lysobacter sp.]
LSGLSTTTFSSKALLEKTERELRRLPLRDQPRLLARGLATLARSYTLVGDYTHAGRLTDEALRVLDRAGESDAFVTSARVSMLNLNNRYREAAALAAKQLDALGDRDDEQTRLTRVAYTTELARAQWGMGRTEEATRTANALVEQTGTLGPGNHEVIAQALMLRAGFFSRLLRPEQAEADMRKAIELVRVSNPVLAGDGLDRLVNLVARRGSAETLPLAEELVRNRRDTLGESHPKTAQAKLRLALTRYPNVSNDDVSKALAVLKASYGGDNPAYASALSAGAWAVARDPPEKIALLRQAADTLQRTTGPRTEVTLAAQYNLGKDLIGLPDAIRTPHDLAEGMELLQYVMNEMSRAGVPPVNVRTMVIVSLLMYGDPAQLPRARALLDENRREALRYYRPGDGEVTNLEYISDWLLYRQGQQEQADRNFARRIEDADAFMREANADLDSEGIRRSGLLSQSLVFRALYAHQRCDRAQALAFMRQAESFDLRVFGADNPITQAVTNSLDSLRRHGRMIATADAWLMPPNELERINRQAQACPSQRSH